MRTLFAVLAVTGLVLPARADEKIDTAKVEQQARAVGKAFLAGEWSKVVDATPPRVVELGGGKEKLVERIETEMKRVKDQGFSFTAYKVGTAQPPVVSGKTVYVVVPTSLSIAAPGTKIVTDSYLLAISDDGGKTWVFADGAGLADAEKRKTLFPDLPKELKLPDGKPPTVTKE